MVMIAKNRKSLFYEMKRFQLRITMNSQMVRLEEIKVPKAECWILRPCILTSRWSLASRNA